MRFSTLGYFLVFGAPGSPDSLAKSVLNIDVNSQRNSIQFDSALFRIARSRFFLLDNAKLNHNPHCFIAITNATACG
jgi:hypothetical protein